MPQDIEQEIQAKGLTAPRVTPADIEAEIASEHYFTGRDGVLGMLAADGVAATPYERANAAPAALGLLTFCVLVLRNGFTVTGESACASPENFDAEIGRKIARADAVRQVWPLLGFMLRQRLHEAQQPKADIDMLPIARACHEVNRAYCQALGDNSQPAWEDAPQWQRDSALTGVRMHLEHPEAGPEASHESWLAEKQRAGWVYGNVKDPECKTHPCMVPFGELPREQQAKDFIFRAVVHAMAHIG